MPAKVLSAATIGIEAVPIEVEVDVSSGLHSFKIVGLADKAVEESKERVAAAIKNSGAASPLKHNRRITVNLAPADFKKEGAGYDLAIAVGFLLATSQIFPIATEKKLFLGELALDGKVRRISGVLPIVEMAVERKFETVFLPEENIAEASFFKNIELIPVQTLADLVLHLEGKRKLQSAAPQDVANLFRAAEPSFEIAEIAGLESAKRAFEIAAAGAHNILLEGSPGTGKSLLAQSLPSILPRLTLKEAIEVTKIYSISGLLSASEPIIRHRPFRAPHHTASGIAIIGGGAFPKPGEASLAHRGVLFLDEFPEFHRSVVENLRQPLESGEVTVSRARGRIAFPAKFMLVAAMNPCPCGFYGDETNVCRCSMSAILKYRNKLSGPLLDRIDLSLRIPKTTYQTIRHHQKSEATKVISQRVEKARERQLARFEKGNQNRLRPIFANSEMGLTDIKSLIILSEPLHRMLGEAERVYYLSPRALHRIIKVSRTIADLEGADEIKEAHLAEALQYRQVTPTL